MAATSEESSPRRSLLRPFDWISLAVAVLITVGAGVLVYGQNTKAETAVVEAGGQTWVLPLDADTTLDVPGPLGTTVVEVAHGAVHVESSPCKNQVCVAAGFISLPGQWIACLPNGVIVRIEGESDEFELDATSW